MFYGPYVIIPITICVLYSPSISRDSLYAYSVNFVMITVNANNCKSLIIHTLCRASDFFSSFSSESESSFYIASTKPRGGRPHHLPTSLQTKVLSLLSPPTLIELEPIYWSRFEKLQDCGCRACDYLDSECYHAIIISLSNVTLALTFIIKPNRWGRTFKPYLLTTGH